MATAPTYTDSFGNFGMPSNTPAPTPATPVTPTPAPVESAAVTAARANPLYIGSTNFGNLQKQYTPYQIEQATTRDANGNIFYKQGVDITKIPTAAPGTKFTSPTTIATPGTDNLPKTNTPAPTTFTTPTPQTAADLFSTGQSEAAKNYLTGIQSSIDGLLKQQQEMQAAAKAQAQGQVDALTKQFQEMTTTTASQDRLDADRKLFQVEQNIRTFSEIQGKINDATAALDQGIIYEQSQPVRMALLTGRSAELKKQGLAHIGALQATAELVKGNIELARAYASDSLAAIKADTDQRVNALNTLLTLSNNKLVTLTKDEKDTIDARMKLLNDQAEKLDKNKDELLDLAKSYPLAFTQGGVLLTDTPEQAIAKMAQYMGAKEKLELESKRLENLKTSAEINKLKTGGSGSGTITGTGVTGAPLTQEIAGVIANLQSQKFSQTDIRAAIYQMYGGKGKASDTQLAGILDNILQGTIAPKDVTPVEEQKNRVLAKQQDLEAKGVLKLDPTDGTYTRSSNGADIEAAAAAKEITWNGTSWVDKYGNEISDPSRISYKKDRWFGDDVKY